MRGYLTYLVGIALVLLANHAWAEVSVTVDPKAVLGRIDERVYGHFLEHIYHSCNGGLWGELVWNRSFEEQPGAGQWCVADDVLAQESLGTNVRLVFGDAAWTDYEFSLEAKKTGGQEGFLILFRVAGEEDFYWVNLGGWGNTRHSLERGKTGARWHRVGPDKQGAIEENRWYRIRVRCEGPHFSVWLDDETIIDWTDEDAPHLAGAVGVGTWATQAEFREIAVRTLDGTVLHEGLPAIPQLRSLGRHWEAFGPGQCRGTKENPLNSAFCVAIENETGETGLRQTPFCIRPLDTFHGSLWMRGEAPGGVRVRMRDGDRVLAERGLGAPKAEWHSYPFEFHFEENVHDAALEIAVDGPAELWVDQVSLMPDTALDTGGFRPDLLKAIADLDPPTIRWPGGCFASAYRWQWGIGPQHERVACDREMWEDRDVNSLGTDEFIALCRAVGAEPIIVINAGSWDTPEKAEIYLEEALAWLEYCNGPADSAWGKVRAANGHPEPYHVKYWEIDNETWGMGSDAYVERVKQFAPALRAADPDIELLACGSGGFNLDWNRRIIEGCGELFEYLSIHHYESPGKFAEGPGNFERFIEETGALIAASANPDMRIYVSEWNAQSTDWRTGLYAGGLLNAFERCTESLAIGGPALFLRHVSATDWDNAFINFNHCSWFPAPNYVVMRLYREHYLPCRVAVAGDTGPLNLVATAAEDGAQVVVKAVNPTDAPVAVEAVLRGYGQNAKATLTLVEPGALDARNTLDHHDAVRPKAGLVRTAARNSLAVSETGKKTQTELVATFTLPPYAVGLLVIE